MRRRRLRAHGRAPGDARSRAARAGVKRSAAHAKRRGKAVTQHAMR
ncbi:histone H1 protein [Burkholderia pseudomallei]|nr:histone H1 protein [Burkholderia pseudomallei]